MSAGYEKLIIYSLSIDGVILIYTLTRNPIFSKDFEAEGYGRHSVKDFYHFISISLGSLNEVQAYLDIIKKLYPNVETLEIKTYYQSLGKQIFNFRKSLSTQQKTNSQ